MDSTSPVIARTMEIAKGTLVKDPKESIEYKLTQYLGSGKYSHVYSTEPVSAMHRPGNRQHKAVKFGFVSHEDMGGSLMKEKRLEELRLRYDEEFTITDQIRTASNGRYVPLINKGEWIDSEWNSIPVLIMDRMGSNEQDWSLAHQIRASRESGRILEAERLAVMAGTQYTELLRILHEGLNKACPDRKSSDFYWDPHASQLYVLDWNVVEDLPTFRAEKDIGSTTTSERAKKIQTEIRQFGERWFEMLIGISVSGVDNLRVDQPTSGSIWARLSQGMRRLLIRTLTAGVSQDGPETDEAAHTAWRAYRELLFMSPTELKDRALSEREKARQSSSDKREWRAAWDTISDIQDLLEAMQESYAKGMAKEIASWVSGRDSEVEEQLHKKFDSARQLIEIGDYEKAIAPFQSVAEDERLPASHRLNAVRWSFAAQMLSAATSQSSDKGRRLKELLIPLLGQMQSDDWSAAHKKIETMKHEGF